MLALIKNKNIFSLLFFLILLVDIYVKIYLEDTSWRYASKPFVNSLLILFFIFNKPKITNKKFLFMLSALCICLLGDIFFIKGSELIFFALGMACIFIAKVLYILYFSNFRDFEFARIFPFLGLCVVWILLLLNLIMEDLKEFYFPVLIYLFVTLLMLAFALLRKDYVNRESYILVLIGIIFVMFSESVTVIKTFSIPNFAYEKTTIMLFYGLSQYFIVLGVCKMKRQTQNVLE